MGLKISPAVLKSLSQAAEAGRGVLSFSDTLQTAGKDFRTSMYHPGRPGRTLAWFPTVYAAGMGLEVDFLLKEGAVRFLYLSKRLTCFL